MAAARPLLDPGRAVRGGPSEALALRVAAWMHDAGAAIDLWRHARHSAYLIQNYPIWGLDQREILLASMAAYLHEGGSLPSAWRRGSCRSSGRRTLETAADSGRCWRSRRIRSPGPSAVLPARREDPRGGFSLRTVRPSSPAGRRRSESRCNGSSTSRCAPVIPETPSPPTATPGASSSSRGSTAAGSRPRPRLIGKWLQSRGYRVFFTEWNSSDLVSDTIRRGKKKGLLTPTTFSLLHATDFADRFERQILPPLRAGYVVVCDRYVYTAFVRDAARGLRPEVGAQHLQLRPAAGPDVLLPGPGPGDPRPQARLPARRSPTTRPGWTSGSRDDVTESYERFQGRLKREYDRSRRPTGSRWSTRPAGRADPGRAARRELRPLLERVPDGGER